MRARRRRRRGLRAFDILAGFGLIMLLALAAARFQSGTEPVEGTMSAVDGDTLRFGERRIRLLGIDAPEIGQMCQQGGTEQACGRNAARFLRDLIDDGPVECVLAGRDRYGRDLGDCRVGEVFLNREMVRAGLALAYGSFESEEALAQAERAGLWGMEFETPANYRREQGMAEEPVHAGLSGFRGLIRRLFGF